MSHTLTNTSECSNDPKEPVQNTIESLKRQITKMAVKLVMGFGVRERTLHKWIKDALLVSVEGQPRVPVLFNTCFGGYSFSKHFLSYLGSQGHKEKHWAQWSSNEMRIIAAKAIPKYGKHVCQQWPVMANLLHAYMGSQVVSMTKIACSIVKEQAFIDNLEHKVHMLRQKVGDPFSPFADEEGQAVRKPTVKTLLADSNSISCLVTMDMRRSDLRRFLDQLDVHALITERQKRLNDMQNENDWLAAPEAVRTALTYFMRDFRLPVWRLGSKDFADSLLHGAEHDPTAWMHQRQLDRASMSFLAKLYIDINSSHLFAWFLDQAKQQVTEDELEVRAGLFCASGAYSDLAIKWMPPRLDWVISECDGKENVQIP